MNEDDILKNEKLSDEIEAFIETEIQPFVHQDGGHIEFRSFDSNTGVVRIQMAGACATCPSSVMTLKFGIELRLKEAFPQITAVETPPSLLDLDI